MALRDAQPFDTISVSIMVKMRKKKGPPVKKKRTPPPGKISSLKREKWKRKVERKSGKGK